MAHVFWHRFFLPLFLFCIMHTLMHHWLILYILDHFICSLNYPSVLQVGMYKLLFDGLVRGEVKKDHVLTHLKLRSGQVLGAGVQAHAKRIGVLVTTFEELVDALLITVSGSDLPCIDLLQIEYFHQGSSGPIGTRVAPFDEAQQRAELQVHLAYWRGQREPKGVDIEEAWKCKSCLYEQTCDWTKNRLQVSDQQADHASSWFSILQIIQIFVCDDYFCHVINFYTFIIVLCTI